MQFLKALLSRPCGATSAMLNSWDYDLFFTDQKPGYEAEHFVEREEAFIKGEFQTLG